MSSMCMDVELNWDAKCVTETINTTSILRALLLLIRELSRMLDLSPKFEN